MATRWREFLNQCAMYRQVFIAFIFSILGTLAQAEDTVSIVVERDEQLGTIAERYFKRPAYVNWPEVAKLNNLKEKPYTIYPGMVLQLPVRLLATQSSPAKWLVVTGNVRIVSPGASQSVLALVGAPIAEGSRVVVGADASGLLELPDGSQVKLLGGAQFILEESRYYRGYSRTNTAENNTGTRAFSGLMRLLQGAIETKATPATDRAKPLRIQTPTTVVGVRGTDFRVTHGLTSASDAGDAVTRSEVVYGLVSAELDEKRKTQVPGGYGVRLDPKVLQIPTPVPLLDAPSLQNWPSRQETINLGFPALPSEQSGRLVSAYRVQMATDEGMSQLVFNQRFNSGQIIRVPTVQDGAHYLTVRGVDDQGLEGKDAKVAVTVNARPQPPLLKEPKGGEKLAQGSDVTLSWEKLSNVSGYILEIKDDSQKRTQYPIQGSQYEMRNLSSGSYTWRIASQMRVGADAIKTGTWSDAQSFTVVAKLDPPEGKLNEYDRTLHLRWADQSVKEYEVQVSRVANFDSNMKEGDFVTHTVKKPELDIPDPAAGKHFIRYRFVEENGFVSGWSGITEMDVPKDLRSLWLLIWTAITVAL